jgi:hypothetical protein
MVITKLVATGLIAIMFPLPGGMSKRIARERATHGAAIATNATLQPKTALFGQRVTARLDIAFDGDQIRPDSVHPAAQFGAYSVLEQSRRKTTVGGDVYLQYRYLLECLTTDCLAPSGGTYAEFAPVTVKYQAPGSDRTQSMQVDWSPLRLRSRIGVHDFEGRAFAGPARDLPTPSYRLDPTLLAAGAAVLAAVLFVAGLGALGSAIGASSLLAAALARRRSGIPALYRALALVRQASDRRERRRALDRLAAELRRSEEHDLAIRATGLAWRRVDPSDTTVEPLSHEVERLAEHEVEP